MSETYFSPWRDVEAALPQIPPFALVFFLRGNAWAERGNLDRAIADYDAAITINPSFAEAYINRGIACAKKGYLERAIADYEAALRINPRDAKAIKNRSLTFKLQDDLTQVLNSIKNSRMATSRQK